jgi:hypothetical protein
MNFIESSVSEIENLKMKFIVELETFIERIASNGYD